MAFAVLVVCSALVAGAAQCFAGSQSPSDAATVVTEKPSDDGPMVAPVKRVAPVMPENKAKLKAAAGNVEKSAPSAKPKPNQKAAGN